MLILTNFMKYVCRHKDDEESQRSSQRQKWEKTSSYRKQATWRDGQSRSWQRTEESTDRILKRHKTWRKPHQNSKASLRGSGLVMEERMERGIMLVQSQVDLQPEGKDAELAMPQVEVRPNGAPTIPTADASDHLQKMGSVRTETRAEVEFFAMPSQASAARLEPMLADAGMPPIIMASVVNASPVTQPDVACSAGLQSPVQTQNVAARAGTREKTRAKDNPATHDSREFELTWM